MVVTSEGNIVTIPIELRRIHGSINQYSLSSVIIDALGDVKPLETNAFEKAKKELKELISAKEGKLKRKVCVEPAACC